MARARILVADDDDMVLGTITWLLKERGYDVVAARGFGALQSQMQRSPPEVLVLDAAMGGFEERPFFETLEDDPNWRNVRVVVLAERGGQREAARLLGLGASDSVEKPLDARELLARVQVQVRISQELRHAREELRSTESELHRAREEAESRRKLVDILHEVSGDFSSEELAHLLVRRVARALNVTHCALILARPGETGAVVATAFENPTVRRMEILLGRHPEIRHALETGRPVLIEDVAQSALSEGARAEWDPPSETAPVRSMIVLPFTVEMEPAGVVFLRTTEEETPLTRDDVEFADTVVRAAVAAMRRAQLMEATRADTARLERLAITDPLTQVLNRRALTERLSTELDRARRYGLTMSVLMIDLDNFKNVNDTYGHLVGDEVLRELAKILQREARSVDMVARYGGEEFVMVLPETPLDGAVALAERIRQRVEEAQLVTGDQYTWLRLGVSIGVASVPDVPASLPNDLIAAADRALYRAKAEGRNRVRT